LFLFALQIVSRGCQLIMLTGPYYGDELGEKDQLEATDSGAEPDVSIESAYPSEKKKQIPPQVSASHAND